MDIINLCYFLIYDLFTAKSATLDFDEDVLVIIAHYFKYQY